MNKNIFDIIVIGGGPAGSSSAMLLSKKGFSVALIEKKVFPREVLCGEFISREVTEFLEDNSLFEDFLKLNPNPITSFRFIGSNGKEIASEFSFRAFALKRSKLDQFLLLKARDEGVKVFQPAEVKDISVSNTGYTILLKSPDNLSIYISSKIIIAAYGKQNILDKILHRHLSSVNSQFNGIKMHVDINSFNDLQQHEIRIYTGTGMYCGLNAVDENTITVCYLYDREKFKTENKKMLEILSCENPKFASLLKENFITLLNSCPVYGTGDIYFGARVLTDKGIFYLGDAAGVIAPLAGDGIAIAVQSAQLLTGILYKNNLDVLMSSEDYNREWRKQFSGRMHIAGIIQSLIMNKTIEHIGLNIVSFFPFLLPKLIRYTRG
jgi:flavin-dependent dehydrogenase